MGIFIMETKKLSLHSLKSLKTGRSVHDTVFLLLLLTRGTIIGQRHFLLGYYFWNVFCY